MCEDFEFRAVQRRENLVHLEKRCKMSIWTQKSALIQLRTSPLKFDDLVEKSEKSSVSNCSTKGPTRAPCRARCAEAAPNRPAAAWTGFPLARRFEAEDFPRRFRVAGRRAPPPLRAAALRGAAPT